MTVRDNVEPIDGVIRITGIAPAKRGDRYIRQLASHWSHKFAVTESEGVIHIAFKIGGVAEFSTRGEQIIITIEANDRETADQLKQVVATHLDRFAFRESPLDFDWKDAV